MNKTTLFITATVIVLGTIGGYFVITSRQVQPTEIIYQEVAVKQGDIAVSFSTDAVIQGEIISITAPVSEKITDMAVGIGAEVTAGQHLFTLDKSKLQYQYNAAMATFSKATYERNQIDQVVKPDAYSAAQQVVNSTYAQLQIAKLALDQTYVTSPVAGIVAEANARVGEYPTTSQGPVVSIVKKDSLYVSTVLDEAEISKVTKDTQVTITLDALGKKTQGVILALSPIAVKDSAGYSVYPVIIAISDKTLPIRVGFEGSVQFITKTVKDAIQIPVTAVFSENGKTYVLKKNAESNEKTEVVAGFTDGKVVAITSGLALEDIILIKK